MFVRHGIAACVIALRCATWHRLVRPANYVVRHKIVLSCDLHIKCCILLCSLHSGFCFAASPRSARFASQKRVRQAHCASRLTFAVQCSQARIVLLGPFDISYFLQPAGLFYCVVLASAHSEIRSSSPRSLRLDCFAITLQYSFSFASFFGSCSFIIAGPFHFSTSRFIIQRCDQWMCSCLRSSDIRPSDHISSFPRSLHSFTHNLIFTQWFASSSLRFNIKLFVHSFRSLVFRSPFPVGWFLLCFQPITSHFFKLYFSASYSLFDTISLIISPFGLFSMGFGLRLYNLAMTR